MTARSFWLSDSLSDSSDSSVTVKTHNCHHQKCTRHKGFMPLSDSSDSSINSLAQKNKHRKRYICMYKDYIVYIWSEKFCHFGHRQPSKPYEYCM